MIITNLIGQNQAQQAAEAAQDAQDVQSQAAIYDHMMRDPNVPVPLKAAALKHGMGLLEEHGGKQIQDQLPQFGQQLGNLVRQSAQKGMLNRLVAMAQQQGALPPGMPGRPAPTPMTSPLPEWMKGPATPLDQPQGQPGAQSDPNAPPPGTNLEYWNGPGGASLATLAGLPRQTPSPGLALASEGLPDDPNAPPTYRTLAGLPTRGVPQEAWRASLAPAAAQPKPHMGARQRIADILGRIAMATGYRSPEQQAMMPQLAQLRAQRIQQQQQLSDLNNALVNGWITSEEFQERRRDVVMGLPSGGTASRQRVNLTYPDGSDVTLDHDPRTGKFYDAQNREIRLPAGTTFALPAGVTREKELQSEAEDIAKAIIAGRRPPVTTGLGRAGLGGKVEAILAREGYDTKTAMLDWDIARWHYRAANNDRQLKLQQATTFALESLDTMDNPKNPGDDLIGELRGLVPRTDFPILNKAALEAAKENAFGAKAQSAARLLDSQISDLTAELGVVYMGGNTNTDKSIDLASKQLKGEWEEQTLRNAIGLARRNLGLRINSIRQAGAVGLSEQGQQQYGVPAAFGGADTAAGGGRFSGGAGQVPTIDSQKEWDALPSGARYIDKKDGKTYIKK